MLRAHLHRFVESAARTAVINHDDKAAPQIRGHDVNPIERRLVRFRLGIIGKLNEDEFVLRKPDTFAGEIYRQGIEQLVREMDASEWLQIPRPFNFFAKPIQRCRLSILQNGKRLGGSVAQCAEKFWEALDRKERRVGKECRSRWAA